jgi:hypothetical protein
MKPLIAFAALALGVGAVGVTLTIQSDRFAFTHMGERSAILAEIRRVEPPRAAPAAELSRTIQLNEVMVEGVLRPTPTLHKIRHPAPAPVVEPVIHVVPAPCVEGDYRKLEENRGVRLMCPGNPELGSPSPNNS